MVWSIAFHPTRPEVMYCGTAPVNLYRSEDNGDNWTKLTAESPEHCVMGFPTRMIAIAVDPGRPDDVYAALEVSGVLRSSDGGDSWSDLSQSIIDLSERPHLKSRIGSDRESEGMLDSHALVVSAAQPASPILAVRMGLFRSRDRGQSWRDMEVGRHSPLTYCRDVVVSPHDARVLYACLSPAARSNDGTLYRSADLGETWQRFDHGVKANGTMMAAAVIETILRRSTALRAAGRCSGPKTRASRGANIGCRRTWATLTRSCVVKAKPFGLNSSTSSGLTSAVHGSTSLRYAHHERKTSPFALSVGAAEVEGVNTAHYERATSNGRDQFVDSDIPGSSSPSKRVVHRSPGRIVSARVSVPVVTSSPAAMGLLSGCCASTPIRCATAASGLPSTLAPPPLSRSTPLQARLMLNVSRRETRFGPRCSTS